jgi:predicted nucleic-acid-binding protein
VIGLDTNVVVRYVVQDDARQAAVATRLFERNLSPDNPGFVSCITLCETAWVLAECYDAGREQIAKVLEGLLASKQLVVEQPDAAWKALRAWRASSADFADALIGQIVAAHGGEKTVTFDRAAAKLAGFELLQSA